MAEEIQVDVISDVVCPWCFVGKRRLEAALELLPDINVKVRWRPYQLDPTIPAGGVDRRQYMLSKFGSEERIHAAHERLVVLGQEAGIKFDFGAIETAPNTLDAHRLIRWAQNAGEGAQSKVVTQLFSYYFEQGKDIGDRRVLLEAASAAGMDAAIIEPLLAGDADKAEVEKEIAAAARMGVTGVPCFLLDGKYAVMGAQDVDTLTNAIRQVAENKDRAS